MHAGFIDTDMAAGVSGDKVSPESVAHQIVTAVATGTEEVLADATSELVKAALPADPPAPQRAPQAPRDRERSEARGAGVKRHESMVVTEPARSRAMPVFGGKGNVTQR